MRKNILILSLSAIILAQGNMYYNTIHKEVIPTRILVQSAPEKPNKNDLILIDYSVNKYSEQYGVDKNLIHAIIKHESGYRKNVVSSAGAIGLMQIMPVHRCPDPFDIELNIKYGTRLISGLIRQYDGNVSKALWAYNTGSGNVARGMIPNSTKRYAENIIRYSEKIGDK